MRKEVDDGSFGALVMRRRVDDVWATVFDDHGFQSFDAAKAAVSDQLRDEGAPEPLPPGVRRREGPAQSALIVNPGMDQAIRLELQKDRHDGSTSACITFVHLNLSS